MASSTVAPSVDWQAFRSLFFAEPELGLSLDLSAMRLADDAFDRLADPFARAFDDMAQLEAGAIANPDEGRQVGHYWLRAPATAPEPAMRQAIEETLDRVEAFAREIHRGERTAANNELFSDLLLIGIGGSALGPQLVADALGHPDLDRLRPHFFDNTDPDGMERTLDGLGAHLATTLVVVVSKSGSTPETRNGLEIASAAWAARGLDLATAAVAITGVGSHLDRRAEREGWMARFPMWEWVGGRTSVTSAVGLLPAALQGVDIRALLRGAAACDTATRRPELRRNPAALLALAWFEATGGRGAKDMVVLPYKDRLALFARYLQQLVMESLGKGRDLAGNEIAQGLTVYGNKGSTDQHAYVQQLREGVENFFAVCVQVLEDGGAPLEIEPRTTAGDFLRAFLLGTRQALTEAGRRALLLTLDRVDAFHLGVLIALFERAVGLYASLIRINAYHQPGVEAGKKAAAAILDLQRRALAALAEADAPMELDALASALDAVDRQPTLYYLLAGLAANGRVARHAGGQPLDSRWSAADS
ncbi:MAG: glucose-6-phosphate isomerase [Acidobacteriota bacterium]